jgi:CRISPR-associated protein Csy2
VSLVLQFDNITVDDREQMISAISHLLHASMRMAGGDIKAFQAPFCINCKEGDDQDLRKVQRTLMPGYALIERRDLMLDAMEHGADALDALIDYLAIHHQCETDNDGKVTWSSYRKSLNNKPAGWIVPIAIGFQGFSALGQAKNQRDSNTPHRFAESVVTLGEFKMPHRIRFIEDILWRYHSENDLYLCQQNKHATPKNELDPESSSIESEFN